jgi:hypothetical protein
VPTSLFAPGVGASLAVMALFAVVCWAGTSRAVLIFTAVAWIPYTGFAQVAGSEAVQVVRAVELFATVLIARWAWRWVWTGAPSRGAPLDRPLLGLLVVAALSLVSGMTWLDPAIPAEHVKLTVSIGQILLLVWPIGLYRVVADAIQQEQWVRWIEGVILLLAVPTLAYPFLPDTGDPGPVWSVPFALVAAPLCFARLLEQRPGWWTPTLLGLAIAPVIAGVVTAKAYWYLAGGTALLTVAWVRARILAFVLGPLLVSVIILGSYLALGDPLPPPVRSLVSAEIAQQSIAGPYGRERLLADALRIWTGHPLLGAGPGNIWPYMHTYSVLDTAHNQFANILLELGLAGLGCFTIFVIRALRMGMGLVRTLGTSRRRSFALGWLGLFVGTLVGGITGDVMFPSIRNGGLDTFALAYPQWIMLGLVVSLARIDARERSIPAAPLPPLVSR